MQQGPVQQVFFRLSPCVNLFYCLLLFNHPMGSIPTEDTAVIGIWPQQTKLHVPRNQGLIIGSCQPLFLYKDRIPLGVFGVTSLVVYASAPNHVFGQMLGLPGSWVCRLMFRSYRLRRPKENYCDFALVIPDEHLSRESRKLTVMI